MAKEILINSGIREVRAAVLTGGNVSEIFIERLNKKSAAGNIYKGKVVKVLPGMQSAFVEIGLQRAAFLHVADIYTGNSDELSYEEKVLYGQGRGKGYGKISRFGRKIFAGSRHLHDGRRYGRIRRVAEERKPHAA